MASLLQRFEFSEYFLFVSEMHLADELCFLDILASPKKTNRF